MFLAWVSSVTFPQTLSGQRLPAQRKISELAEWMGNHQLLGGLVPYQTTSAHFKRTKLVLSFAINTFNHPADKLPVQQIIIARNGGKLSFFGARTEPGSWRETEGALMSLSPLITTITGVPYSHPSAHRQRPSPAACKL